jgi:hypothetical protein
MSDDVKGSPVPSAPAEGQQSAEPIPASIAKALQSHDVNLSDPEVRRTATILAQFFAGPIPPPEFLERLTRK